MDSNIVRLSGLDGCHYGGDVMDSNMVLSSGLGVDSYTAPPMSTDMNLEQIQDMMPDVSGVHARDVRHHECSGRCPRLRYQGTNVPHILNSSQKVANQNVSSRSMSVIRIPSKQLL